MGRIVMMAALMLATACGERYEGFALSRVAGADEASASGGRISVPEGRVIVVSVGAEAAEGQRDYDVTDTVELRGTNESIARVEPSVRVDQWMVFGTAAGETEIEVLVNGELQDVIPVEVEPTDR